MKSWQPPKRRGMEPTHVNRSGVFTCQWSASLVEDVAIAMLVMSRQLTSTIGLNEVPFKSALTLSPLTSSIPFVLPGVRIVIEIQKD